MINKNILFNKLIDRHKFSLEQLNNLIDNSIEVIYKEDGIICLIEQEDYNYLVVKSVDEVYSLSFLRESFKLILKSKKSLATSVEGESFPMRKILNRVGFVEKEEEKDFYILEK